MPNPTSNFNWRYPTEGQDPWYTTFASTYSHMAVSVRSVELLCAPRMSLVMSWYGGSGVTLGGLTSGVLGTSWTVFSALPQGQAIGAFTMAQKGGAALFILESVAHREGPTIGDFPAAPLDVFYQLVVQAGSMMVSSGGMMQRLSGRILKEPYQCTAVLSIGPGDYTIWAQGAIRPWGTDSRAVWDLDSHIIVNFLEVASQ